MQTQYGWHVIQLEDTREAAPPPFDQVKPQLTDAVMRKKLQAYVEDMKKQAKIEKKPDAMPRPPRRRRSDGSAREVDGASRVGALREPGAAERSSTPPPAEREHCSRRTIVLVYSSGPERARSFR